MVGWECSVLSLSIECIHKKEKRPSAIIRSIIKQHDTVAIGTTTRIFDCFQQLPLTQDHLLRLKRSLLLDQILRMSNIEFFLVCYQTRQIHANSSYTSSKHQRAVSCEGLSPIICTDCPFYSTPHHIMMRQFEQKVSSKIKEI